MKRGHEVAILMGLFLLPWLSLAQEVRSLHACIDKVGAVTYHPRPVAGLSCSVQASGAAPARTMIHQDASQQILVETGSAARAGDGVDVALVVTYTAMQDRAGATPHRSLWRQQRFDCRAGGGTAVLEERLYEQALARGDAVSARRTPDAVARPIAAGSAEAAVRHVLCEDGEKSG